MRSHVLPAACTAVLLLALPSVWAKDDKWVEARSKNFVVVSDASASQARNTAIQFEQIRELFRSSFAFANNEPTPVITILAVKNENSLREILPEYWVRKDQAHPAGIFINSLYQFAVAVNLGQAGDNPFESVYHEYYHSLTVPYFPGLPVWIAEGLAEFYGNTEIKGKEASVGVPSEGWIELLHQQNLIPLSVLFHVDHNSPYYNENNKTSIFYAESWALTHYMMLGDNGVHRKEFGNYLRALDQGVGQDEAASMAFGSLEKLQKVLQGYTSRPTLYEIKTPAPARVNESEVQVRALSEAEADAYRGGFLVLHGQIKEAQPLLEQAVQLDPKSALTQQNLGVFYDKQQKYDQALTAFSTAIAADPKNALTRFLRAQLGANGNASQSRAQVEDDLHQAIAADPDFAPPYAVLAMRLIADQQKLPEALALAKKGVILERGNSYYQLVLAQVLARIGEYDQAETVAARARANALDSGSKEDATRFIEFLGRLRQEDVAPRNQIQSAPAASTDAAEATPNSAEPPIKQPKIEDSRQRVDGTITDLQCFEQSMQIIVTTKDGVVKLHAADFNKVEYISDSPLQSEEFWPCKQLKGRTVKVMYVPSPDRSQAVQGDIGTVEIRK